MDFWKHSLQVSYQRHASRDAKKKKPATVTFSRFTYTVKGLDFRGYVFITICYCNCFGINGEITTGWRLLYMDLSSTISYNVIAVGNHKFMTLLRIAVKAV
ncbi:hypothetical protein GDO81_007850 [Engystomops pustulosus]|uniref:Uncharacterized protein n=1 Tax=Engystomops pustulosus TaxID=76066 RepID=A0AAV7CAE4_ENGPU|nr:hypothetical protein GDO81_007850 [Engystomops pustulosus]